MKVITSADYVKFNLVVFKESRRATRKQSDALVMIYMETPYNEQFRNLLKFSMRKSHQIKAFGVFTGEFFQNGTCFAMLPIVQFVMFPYFKTVTTKK